jgi:parvulin-like peptidyl-prolyl isomerase
VVRLQRAKERKGIHDIHLGLSEEALARMLELLAEAVAGGEDYAPNAAAEIDAFIDRGLFDRARQAAVRAQVEALLTGRRPGG